MVSPPTRPKYMRKIKIILEAAEKRALPPRDRPTVPMAEAASNKASISGTASMQQIKIPPVRNSRMYKRKMAQALWRAESWTRRPKHWALRRRRKTAAALSSRTARVVVFLLVYHTKRKEKRAVFLF